MLLDSKRQSVATILLDSKQSVAHTMDPGYSARTLEAREPAEAEVAAVPVFGKPF